MNWCMMASTRAFVVLLSVILAIAAATPYQRVRAKRQLADDNTLQPLEDADGDEQTREKRKLEGVTEAKFGIKNAVLGFVFGDGIIYRRQGRATEEKPARVSLLPTLTSSSSSITPGPSSRTADTSSKTADASSKAAGTSSRTADTSSITRGSTRPSSLTQQSRTSERGLRQADDIPVFDRNKVSLDFPGALFGPSLSLLIRTTKIVGDVIQNSAVRYQSFLRLFRPLFKGQFEIKGLDPPTTTTTTTTTTTAAPKTADNEVRRR